MAGTIANLIVNVAADTVELKRGVREIQKDLGGFESAIGKVGKMVAGAFTVSAVVSFGKSIIDNAGHIVDLAAKTGLSTEAIQKMQYVAGQTGATLQQFTDAAFQLGVRLSTGGDSVRGGVERLGLSFDQLQKMRPEQQFATIMDALSKMRSEQERNEVGVLLFGKTFANVAASVSEGYSRIADDARISTDKQLRSLDKAGDAWARFKGDVTNVATGALAFVYDQFDKLFPEVDMNGVAMKNYKDVVLEAEAPIKRIAEVTEEVGEATKKTATATRAVKEETEALVPKVKDLSDGLAFMFAKLQPMPAALENMNASMHVLASSTIPGLTTSLYDLTVPINQNISASLNAEKKITGSWNSVVSGMKGGLDSLWKGMTGGNGFDGLMKNLGGSIVSGFGDILSGGLNSVINMGVQLALAGAKKLAGIVKGLFQSEETKKVSDPRDQFFAQFIDKGFGSDPFSAIAGAFASVGGGDVAESMIKMLYDADTASKWKTAQSTVADYFRNRGMPVQSFATGTFGKFMDFGRGTPAILHGRERVMTEAEGRHEVRGWQVLSAQLDELLRVLPAALENAARFGVQTAGRRV